MNENMKTICYSVAGKNYELSGDSDQIGALEFILHHVKYDVEVKDFFPQPTIAPSVAHRGGDVLVGWTATTMYDAIEQVLLRHRLHNLQGEDGEAFPLLDHLCSPDGRTVESGIHEIRLICDEIYNEVLTVSAPESTEPVAHRSGDAIRALIACHAKKLEQNEYAYFELAYTRRTGWMAWICSNHRDDDPNRKIIAKGQGDTPEEACANAIAAPESTEDVAAGEESTDFMDDVQKSREYMQRDKS